MRRTVRLLVVTAGLTLVSATPLAPPAGAGRAPLGRVVFVVVPDLRWSTAPVALTGWARASLALNSVDRQRRIDVYLTIGKGRRTGALGAVTGVGPLDGGPDDVSLRLWPQFTRHDRGLRFGGRLGELGDELAGHGVPLTVVGQSADAAALGADHAGRVRRFAMGGAPDAGRALRDSRLVVVETAGADLDGLLATTTGNCRLIASGSLPVGESHLGAIAVSPECGLGRGSLTSPSTRQAGFVTLPDLAPTLLSLLGVAPPDVFEGGVIRAARPVSRPQLVDEDRRAAVSRDAGKPVTTVFGLAAACGLAGLVRERARLPLAAVLLAMPPALLLMMLVPWWRSGRLAGVLVLVGIAGLVAAAALRAGGRRPARIVLILTAVTAAVIAVDALRGGPLELDAPTINNAIGAGRFFGVGNVPYGFLAGASLGAAGIALDRIGSRALPGVAATLAFVVVADGAPMFGADAGGVLASLPAIGVLLSTWRGRLSRLAVAVTAAVGVAAVAGLAAFELSQPAEHQTHVGRALAGGSVLPTAVRRGLTALDSFKTSPWVLVAAVAVAGLVAARHRVVTGPAVRAAFLGMVVAAWVGAAVNDSGVAVAGPVLFVAWAMALGLAQPRAAAAPAGTAVPESACRASMRPEERL